MPPKGRNSRKQKQQKQQEKIQKAPIEQSIEESESDSEDDAYEVIIDENEYINQQTAKIATIILSECVGNIDKQTDSDNKITITPSLEQKETSQNSNDTSKIHKKEENEEEEEDLIDSDDQIDDRFSIQYEAPNPSPHTTGKLSPELIKKFETPTKSNLPKDTNKDKVLAHKPENSTNNTNESHGKEEEKLLGTKDEIVNDQTPGKSINELVKLYETPPKTNVPKLVKEVEGLTFKPTEVAKDVSNSNKIESPEEIAARQKEEIDRRLGMKIYGSEQEDDIGKLNISSNDQNTTDVPKSSGNAKGLDFKPITVAKEVSNSSKIESPEEIAARQKKEIDNRILKRQNHQSEEEEDIDFGEIDESSNERNTSVNGEIEKAKEIEENRLKILEEEAKRKEEEEIKKAAEEEEAKRKQATEEEAKRKAAAEEEARKKAAAEEEARKKAAAAEEEAKRKATAEEEASRKAEEVKKKAEEARWKAAEEERKKAEAAAKKKEEEEQRRSEEERKKELEMKQMEDDDDDIDFDGDELDEERNQKNVIISSDAKESRRVSDFEEFFIDDKIDEDSPFNKRNHVISNQSLSLQSDDDDELFSDDEIDPKMNVRDQVLLPMSEIRNRKKEEPEIEFKVANKEESEPEIEFKVAPIDELDPMNQRSIPLSEYPENKHVEEIPQQIIRVRRRNTAAIPITRPERVTLSTSIPLAPHLANLYLHQINRNEVHSSFSFSNQVFIMFVEILAVILLLYATYICFF